MAVPVVQVLRWVAGSVITYVSNDGFETNTSGYSVAAGINAAATSITRTTGDHYMGAACGQLVTTSTNGSGVKYVLSDTFASTTTYRVTVALKSVSGTTSAKLLVGSLGTGADRASATFTLTTSWVVYSVDWTPSGTRSDVQINITNNAASVMTANIDAVEMYEAGQDDSADVDMVSFTRGANFEGGLAAGQATIRYRNTTNLYSAGAGRVRIGDAVLVRATYGNVPYALFYGQVSRVVLNAEDRTLDAIVTEASAYWGVTTEVNIATSTTRSIAAFRGLILDAIGVTARQRSLSLAEAEADTPATGADQASGTTVLASLDASTLTLSYVVPDPQLTVLFVYTTLPRNARAVLAAAETIADSYVGVALFMDETDSVTYQRVNWTPWVAVPGTELWTAVTEVPAAVAAATTLTLYPSYGSRATDVTVASTGTITPTLTSYYRGGKITAVGSGTLLTLSVSGTALVDQPPASATYGGGAHRAVRDVEYVPSTAAAAGVAQYLVAQGAVAVSPRGDITVRNHFPSQLQRQLGETLATNPARVFGSLSNTIGTIATTIDLGSTQWDTTYSLFYIASLVGPFVLDSNILNGGSSFLGV